MRGGLDTHVHARPYGLTGLTLLKRRQGKLHRRIRKVKMLKTAACVDICDENSSAECSLKQQIDISDSASISEVSVFTLLNAQ